jgi:hypothetical protein
MNITLANDTDLVNNRRGLLISNCLACYNGGLISNETLFLWTARLVFLWLAVFLFLGFFKISEILAGSIEFLIYSRTKRHHEKSSHLIEWDTCPETPFSFVLRSFGASCFILVYPMVALIIDKLQVEDNFDGLLIITVRASKLNHEINVF